MSPVIVAMEPVRTCAAKAQMMCELLAFLCCVMTTVGQLGILDYYVVHYLQEQWWLALIVLDVGVIACFFWLLALALRYQTMCARTICTNDSNIRYAFVGWLAYSLVLVAKICIIFKLVVQHLRKTETFGPVALEMTLSASALIFLLLVLSHHFSDPSSERQNYLSYLASAVTLDVIDSVVFLKLLLAPSYRPHVETQPTLAGIILFLACFNFVLPTFPLFKLRYHVGLPRWLPLPYEKFYSLLYFLTVNLPFLVIRLFVWSDTESPLSAGSVFLVKNVIMIIIGIREVWIAILMKHRREV